MERTAAEELASRLAAIRSVIAAGSARPSALYGSVTSADIAEALADKGFDIDKRKIRLREPIKKLGESTVPVKLHRDVIVQVKVTSSSKT